MNLPHRVWLFAPTIIVEVFAGQGVHAVLSKVSWKISRTDIKKLTLKTTEKALYNSLRVDLNKGEKFCMEGQNLDHLHTLPIQTGLVHIV